MKRCIWCGETQGDFIEVINGHLCLYCLSRAGVFRNGKRITNNYKKKMFKCKCGMLKISEKSRCACNAKPFNEKKFAKKKPIAQISEKKKERLQNDGTEINLFRKRFVQLKSLGKNQCMITGVTLEFNEDDQDEESGLTVASFPHILPKGKYPEFRYFPNNIGLVKGISEHKLFDEAVNKLKNTIGLEELRRIISSGDEVDISDFI